MRGLLQSRHKRVASWAPCRSGGPAKPSATHSPRSSLRKPGREATAAFARSDQTASGMTHNYPRLRVIARTRFFTPLEEGIKTGDPKTVWEKWISYGSLDEMVEECVSSSGKGKD